GLVTGTVAPARALVAAITPRDELGYSMGLMEASVFLGGAAGPLVGGFLNDRLGFHGTFAIGAALLLLAGLLVLWRVDERFVRPAAAPGRPPHPLAGLGRVAALPGLAVLALVLLMANFGSGAPAPVLPLLVPQLRGVPRVDGVPQTATVVGVILAAAGFCGTLASAGLGGFAAGPLVGGVVGAAAGLRSVFLVTAVALLVVAAVVALRVREPAAAAGAAGGAAPEQEPSPAA